MNTAFPLQIGFRRDGGGWVEIGLKNNNNDKQSNIARSAFPYPRYPLHLGCTTRSVSRHGRQTLLWDYVLRALRIESRVRPLCPLKLPSPCDLESQLPPLRNTVRSSCRAATIDSIVQRLSMNSCDSANVHELSRKYLTTCGYLS